METIYQTAIEAVANGARFRISFQKRNLRINGKYIIKHGEYEGGLGCGPSPNPLQEIERLYIRYRHSVPSQRNDNKRKRYFRALHECELSDEDMLYGVHREEAQIALELFILCQILHGTIKWDDFAEGKWFWQSQNTPSLILLKKWFEHESKDL